MKMSLFKDIVLGIDIGGTTCKCGVFTTDGTLVYKDEIPTRKDEGGSLILSDIKEHIPELVKAAGRSCDEIKGVGIGVPGAVREDGTVNKCVNLGWGVFNVAQTFKDMTGYEVKVGNDANMAALGEYWMGSAKAYSSVVLVTIGTGVGGGKEISKWVEKSGMTPEFKNGLRVTDEPTMEIAEMVLNKVNKSLVSLIEELGVKACGISGKDGGMLKVEKKYSKGEDIGYVGEVKEVDTTLIHSLLKDDFLPVICPIGYDDNFHAYNINADDAACAIARAVNAEKLAFLTDIEGVYKDYNDKSSLISELSTTEARELLAGGTIGGGMLPKLNNCIDAIEHGVSRVHILDGRIPHCLLLEIFTNKGVGTAILSEGAEKFFDTIYNNRSSYADRTDY